MSRRKIRLTLLGTLAIVVVIPNASMRAQWTTADHTAVFMSDGWEDYNQSRMGFPGAVTLTEFESSPGVNDEDAAAAPPDFTDEQRQQSAFPPRSQERMIDRIFDPTAWLVNCRFRESWNWPEGNSSDDSEEFQFRPTVPFRAWDRVNILRVTVPYTVSGPGDPGLGDVTILDLVVHEATWGRWGVGPVVRFTPQSGSGSETFQIGPAAGAVTKDKHWSLGFLTQNFFGENVAESRIQPILAYKFDQQWAVGVGEFEFRYDWEDSTWTQIPLGIQVDHIADIYGQKIQFFVNPQYNFQNDSSNSGWTLFLGVVLLAPQA